MPGTSAGTLFELALHLLRPHSGHRPPATARERRQRVRTAGLRLRIVNRGAVEPRQQPQIFPRAASGRLTEGPMRDAGNYRALCFDRCLVGVLYKGRGLSSVAKTAPYRRPDATGTAHDALLGTDRSQGHRTSTLGCLDECQPGSGWHPRCDCVAVAASHGCSANEATHHQKQSSRLPSKRARRFYLRR